MMSILRLERLLRAGGHRRLIETVLDNGRVRPDGLVERLCRGDGGEAAALGLALLRCCELSYGPCMLATSMAARLRRLQRADGSFGGARAATAIALRGLLAWRDLQEETHARQEGLEPSIRRGLDALDHTGQCGDQLDDAVIQAWLGARAARTNTLAAA